MNFFRENHIDINRGFLTTKQKQKTTKSLEFLTSAFNQLLIVFHTTFISADMIKVNLLATMLVITVKQSAINRQENVTNLNVIGGRTMTSTMWVNQHQRRPEITF